MASACVNNIGMSPESFPDCPPSAFPSYGWLSPRISFSCEYPDGDGSKGSANRSASKKPPMVRNAGEEKLEEPDLEISTKDFVDFEFCIEDPVAMLPADELLADGKLVPLQVSTVRHLMSLVPVFSEARSPDTPNYRRRNEISSRDPYLFSPKAPRCSSRWKELLGLKKLYQNSNAKLYHHPGLLRLRAQPSSPSAPRLNHPPPLQTPWREEREKRERRDIEKREREDKERG